MKQKIAFALLALCPLLAIPVLSNAQGLVIDPVLEAATITTGAAENSTLNDIKSKQTSIEALQATTVATVNLINDWQQKTYNGLLYVSNTLKNVYQIYECYTVLDEIYTNESNMLSIAGQNPLSLAFAAKFQEDMVTKAIEYYGQIQTFILSAGDDKLLMDAGERSQLMNRALDDLRVIDALAYSSYLKVRLVVHQGIISSLDPFAGMANHDNIIVKDVLGSWKF
jgi:hypothetical protein